VTVERATWIDGRKVRDARVRLGLGSYVVARSLGVSTQVIDRLESGGDQRKMSVGFVFDLARVLGTTVDELYVADDFEVVENPDVMLESDPATVGAVVAGNGRVVSVDAVATALGWTLPRTLLALDELTRRLGAVGQRLAWVGPTRVATVAAPVDADVAEQVGVRGFADTGLNRDEAQVVYRVMSNRSMSTATSNPVSVQRLHAAGFLDYANSDARGRANHAVLSDDCRFNLVVATD
jgi:DNA-binding XRE family transcriptional regulator